MLYFEKPLNKSSHRLNSKNNGPVLFFKAIFRHCNCFLSSVAKDGKDGDGLRLETVGPTFSSFNAISAKLTPKISCFIPPDEICLITFFTTLQENQVPVGVVFTQAPYYSPHCFHQKAKNQNKTKKQTKKIYFHFVVCWVHYEGERISGPSLLLDLVPRSLLFPSR